MSIQKELVEKCKKKLLTHRQDIMNGLRGSSDQLAVHISGDEGDIAKALDDQHTSLVQREKLLSQLREIDLALERIEQGTYGICEETEEEIEADRLIAIPWTRVSFEGAEIRERNQKRYAT